MKNGRKHLALVLLLVLLVSFSLTAQGKSETAVTSKAVQVTPVGTYPVVSEPLTLSFLTLQPVYIENFDTNRFAKYWTEKTGVNIDWETIPRDAVKS